MTSQRTVTTINKATIPRSEMELAGMLPHQQTEDEREPLIAFQNPLHGSEGAKVYGFYFISIVTWLDLLALMVFQACIAAAAAAVLYRLVVEPKRANTSFAYLVGYGIMLPCWILWPVYLNAQLDVQNLLFRFAVGSITPTLSIFRTTEAVHGFQPSERSKDLGSYVFYFASPMVCQYAGGIPVRASIWKEVPRHASRFLGFLLLLGTIQSWLEQYPDFCVFGAPDDWYNVKHIFSPRQWANNLGIAVIFQLYLYSFCEGFILATTLATGYRMEAVMDNPLFTSASPAEFWGRKWNMLVHNCLKRGVYKPVRRLGGNAFLGTLAAFAASGLLHEWLVWVIFSPNVVQGGSLVFFLWQVVLVVGWQIVPFQKHSAWLRLPIAVRSLCIVTMALPFVQFFIEPYVISGFFRHAQVLLFMTLPVKTLR